MSKCPECGLKYTGNRCGCGYGATPIVINRCVICNENRDLLPVGKIGQNGFKYIDWYCEPHYLKRVENMSHTSDDLSWCKADPKLAPDADVVKALVQGGETNALLRSLNIGMERKCREEQI